MGDRDLTGQSDLLAPGFDIQEFRIFRVLWFYGGGQGVLAYDAWKYIKELFEQHRIERLTGLAPHHFYGLGRFISGALRPAVRQRIVAIDDREYSSSERYFLELKAGRIPAPIVALVMVFDYGDNLVGKIHIAQDVSGDYRMHHY